MPRPALISAEELADAVVAIVVERGLDAVSIRTVAARAGVSAGAVQHHFASKDELLLTAYQRAIDQFRERARGLPDRRSEPLRYIHELLLQLLPLDAMREAELRVALAFSARALRSPRLAALYAEGYQALVGALSDAIAAAIERGEVGSEIEPRREAARALALADGLAWHSLCAPDGLSPTDAAATLEQHLRLTLGIGERPA